MICGRHFVLPVVKVDDEIFFGSDGAVNVSDVIPQVFNLGLHEHELDLRVKLLLASWSMASDLFTGPAYDVRERDLSICLLSLSTSSIRARFSGVVSAALYLPSGAFTCLAENI